MLYLFSDPGFTLALGRDEAGRGLPGEGWILLKAVAAKDVDQAIRREIRTKGYWLYVPGQRAERAG